MDRIFVYPGAVPLETDILNTNRNAMVGLGKLAAAAFGTGTQTNGFAVTPTGPASLQVVVAPGEIYSLQNLDGTAYSSLAADTAHQIIKQGIAFGSTTLNCPAPGTTGQSINYLIEASFAEVDGSPVALPYYNASNPGVAWSGPSNSGTQQNTVRAGTVVLRAKAGVAAATGSQTTPSPDANFVGLYAVSVAAGQTTITSSSIQALNYSTLGYQVLPFGLILQWGITPIIAAMTRTTVTLPIAFPNNFYQVVASFADKGNTTRAVMGNAYPNTLATLSAYNPDTTGSQYIYLAVGN